MKLQSLTLKKRFLPILLLLLLRCLNQKFNRHHLYQQQHHSNVSHHHKHPHQLQLRKNPKSHQLQLPPPPPLLINVYVMIVTNFYAFVIVQPLFPFLNFQILILLSVRIPMLIAVTMLVSPIHIPVQTVKDVQINNFTDNYLPVIILR